MRETCCRHTNSDGSSKDWTIRKLEAHLEIEYGKTGRRAKQTRIDVKDCPKGLSHEYQRRLNDQLNSGYEIASQSANEPCLYWRSDADGVDRSATLRRICELTNLHLVDASVSASMSRGSFVVRQDDAVALTVPTDGTKRAAGEASPDTPVEVVLYALNRANIVKLANESAQVVVGANLARIARDRLPDSWVAFLEAADVLAAPVNFGAFRAAGLSVGF